MNFPNLKNSAFASASLGHLRFAPILRLCASLLLATTTTVVTAQDHPEILIADFEGDSYGDWTAEGEAFGTGPAKGTLKGQMNVSGFKGKGLVNSFLQGDRTTGTLTSPPFTIERPWINFLIGGGAHEGKTCINLLIDGKIVRTSAGPNDRPGGSETLDHASWDVAEFAGKTAVIQIVDQHSSGWGHVNIDHIVQSNQKAAPTLIALEKTLTVDGTHLIVPVANQGKATTLGIYDETGALIQNFNVALPAADAPQWLAAYPIAPFGLQGKTIKIAPVDKRQGSSSIQAGFEAIRFGAASDALQSSDYTQPYRNQFHASTRRGWNNDPNGMVYHDGKYHLYYQYNPFGIGWGNMHWGHWQSPDMIHWEEQPLALYQKTTRDMAFSGGGFVDFNNSAGLGKNTLFVAFTSTGRGECLAYSRDGGLTFTELEENPVVKHRGRDPKIIWYAPEQKWVMVIFNSEECAETKATPPADPKTRQANANMVFWESKDLRQWTRTGSFTDPDRMAVFECPEFFELPVEGVEGESRWILYGAQNRYFVGSFDGVTFTKESGPHGSRHGAFYAAQTFSDVPDGRRVQVGWIRTAVYKDRFPDQIVNQGMTLPHTMTLHETPDGLRVFFNPVKETESLRGELMAEGTDLTPAAANEKLAACQGELTEVLIEFAEPGRKELVINGIDATFEGRSGRIFTDRTVNEVYADDGAYYEVRTKAPQNFDSTKTSVNDAAGNIKSLMVFRLEPIWP